MKQLILDGKTLVIKRIAAPGEAIAVGEDSVDVPDSVDITPTPTVKYWQYDSTLGIIPATVKAIIESGVGDADRAITRKELVDAMDAMIADTLIAGKIKVFITKLRAHFNYQL